ncbi:hypothetical protein QTH87_08420 [Variovorax sp. J22P168]|uniref:hypothetical protein n=1 Tax=Variovorax jilinensis TaxID=3053513 RepID=UPI002578A62C|nr:hypothetical protein [Variovorax sp. J22P168]MDM0012456.1 hypothetical protein [Variovorax sp. J22P168]
MPANMPPSLERFWLGLVEVPGGFGPELSGDAVGPPLPAASRSLAVDVLRSSDSLASIAVLVSTIEHGASGALSCWVGFSNRVAWGDALRQRGIVTIETPIHITEPGKHGSFTLAIRAPLKAATTEVEAVSQAPVLFTIRGVRFGPRTRDKAVQPPFPLVYAQMGFAPSAGAANSEFVISADRVDLRRDDASLLTSRATLEVADDARFPFVGYRGQHVVFDRSFCGGLYRSLDADLQVSRAAMPAGRLSRSPRPKPFQNTGYRFSDLDLVGMRVDLRPFGADADELLNEMIRPLNFHLESQRLSDRIAALGFSYRPAARTLSIELVRYGRMHWGEQVPEDGIDPFESQYELLMRVLVGRVDDDGAQAHDPAAYVPAIFVDNGWSKVIGRELQGFEKRLARFVDCDGQPLAPPGASPRSGSPLFDIAHIDQLDSLAPGAEAVRIADIALPPIPSDWLAHAQRVDTFGVELAAGPRWQQRDFAGREFRRSFARDVLEDGLTRFRSIQVTPVDGRPLPKAWITGSFRLRDLRSTFPTGIATIKLHSDPRLPRAFTRLRELLGDQPFTVPTGDWYVGRSSLDLSVDDGLV